MKIAVFGLGTIGSIWAQNWRADGYEVKGWNRTPKPELTTFCSDARQAARCADLLAIVVTNATAVRQILDLIEPELTSTSIVAQHSTIGINDTLDFANRINKKGAAFLDMPFTGSKIGAENRQTIYYVGGDKNLLERVAPIYRKISKALIPVGDIGQATALKLAFNLMLAQQYQALAEAFSLSIKAGISPETFLLALDQSPARSGLTDLKKQKLVSEDFTSHFAIKHMHKDLRLALDLAKSYQQPLPQTELLEKTYEKAEQAGLADLDFAALVKTLQNKK